MNQLFQRICNKIRREIKQQYWRKVPFQSEVTFVENGTHWYEPILAGPTTFARDCTSASTIAAVIPILEKLTPDDFIKFNLEFYKTGLERFGSRWCYADINTVLWGICKNINVQNYLEIGVRRGRSMAIIASLHPTTHIVGFDMWIQNYGSIENPGPDFVRGELSKVGYRGNTEFVTGNSLHTVPQYFKKHPDVYFDIITVDGDHSEKGAIRDLKNVIPRLKIGGILVFDDISNPYHPYLKKVWDKIVIKSGRFESFQYDEVGYGAAYGIRKY